MNMGPEKFLEKKNSEAEKLNKERSLMDKVLGRNKVSGLDLVREDAEKEDAVFEYKKAQEYIAAQKNKTTPSERFDIKPEKTKSFKASPDLKNKTPEIKFKCNFCGKEFSGEHLCREIQSRGYSRPINPSEASKDTSSFFTSFIVGHLTDSTLLGYAAGGNLSGAFLGSMTNDGQRNQSSRGGTFDGGGANGSWSEGGEVSKDFSPSNVSNIPVIPVADIPTETVETDSTSTTHSFEEPSNTY